MNNKILTVVVLVVIVVVGWLLLKNDNTKITIPTDSAPVLTETNVSTSVKEFTVEGSSFAFAPKTMSVNKGDTVKITFVNKIGFHDLVIDEFNARTKQIKAGESETITFVADKAGSFEYYCSVGTHRAQGMVGTLTVN